MEEDSVNKWLNPQTAKTWWDPFWLEQNTLNSDNVLGYFSRSEFFEENSINQQFLIQGRPYREDEAKEKKGIEFVVSKAEGDCFVILKRLRHDPDSTDPICYYCVVEGIVFQCP